MGNILLKEVRRMQHHIDQLLHLERYLMRNIDLERRVSEKQGTIVESPTFNFVSIVRQVLAECAHVDCGLYQFTEHFCIVERLEQLRRELHRQANESIPGEEVMGMIDSICYFEQSYEKEDYRLLLQGGYKSQLKFAVCYVLQWYEEGLTEQQLMRDLHLLREKFERIFEFYHFEQNVRYVLNQLVDVDQVVQCEKASPLTYHLLHTNMSGFYKIVEEARVAKTPTLLTVAYQEQLEKLYNAHDQSC